MAEKSPPKEMKRFKLRTIGDLIEANEEIYNLQINGQIDGKVSEQMNGTVKGQRFLLVDMPMKLMDLIVRAGKAKVEIPKSLMPISME